MINVILIFTALTALLNAFLLGGGMILSLLAAAAAIAALVIRILPSEKLAKLKTVIGIAAVAGAFALGLLAGMKGSDGGIINYNNKIRDALMSAEAEDAYAADSMLDQIAEKDTSYLRFARARAAYEQGEIQKAVDIANQVPGRDKHMPDYYLIEAGALLDLGDINRSETLLTEAARLYPEWLSMQYFAGTVSLQNNKVEKGTFFLTNALDLCLEENEYVLKMVGIAYYRQNDFETAKEYLTMALEAAEDEENIKEINEYLDIIAKEGTK